jgi:hypothetical protein
MAQKMRRRERRSRRLKQPLYRHPAECVAFFLDVSAFFTDIFHFFSSFSPFFSSFPPSPRSDIHITPFETERILVQERK